MITVASVAVPVLGGAAVWPRAMRRHGPAVLVAVSVAATLGAWVLALFPARLAALGVPAFEDPTARLFLAFLNVVFLGVAGHVANRARHEPDFRDQAGRFAAYGLPFLGCTNLAVVADDLMLAWCALELTTLLAAPLVRDDGARAKVEASWQYLLFGVVGLALVLAGATALQRAVGHLPLTWTALAGAGAALQTPWAQVGLGLIVAGYGTKLGLVPMNTWLPETYANAPSPVTALLAAVQSNVALLGLLRVVQVVTPEAGELVREELLWLGTASMAVSAAGIVTTRDYLRLLGYASINHAGVIAVGLGLGGVASFGVLVYLLSNAFVKAILFLSAGRVRHRFGTTDAGQVHGLIKAMPFAGAFLMVGTFALLGLPPFGSFLGELMILSAIVESGRTALLFPFCAVLAVSFMATGRTLFPMIWGQPSVPPDPLIRANRLSDALPKFLFLGALVVLGIYLPAPVDALLREVAGTLGGR